MKKWMFVFILFAGIVASANDDFTVPHNTPATAMPSMAGGILYSNTKRAMYISPRVDLRTCQVLGKAKGTVSMSNILLLVNTGDIGWEALRAEALKNYPEADDIVNFTIDAEHFNVFMFYIRLRVNISGTAVKYNIPGKGAK